MKIAEFSVKNSQFTFIIFMAVMALGIGSLLNMPRAEDPKFEVPGFSVIMVYPGAGLRKSRKKPAVQWCSALTKVKKHRLMLVRVSSVARAFSEQRRPFASGQQQ